MIPKKVLIVGGGRTGWMAAAYLNAVLERTGHRSVDIHVLEASQDSGVRGAEAHIPDIKQMLAAIGIDEVEFFKRVKGTFRQATRYDNWLRGTGDFFYHTLDDARAQPIDRAALSWLMSDRSIAFSETVSPQPVICDLGLAPRAIDGSPSDLRLKYTFHGDEADLTGLLRDIAMARGVQRHVDEFAHLEWANDGNIDAVLTAGGHRLEADLFVDCSGMDALLVGQQLNVEWVDCSRWLLCDRLLTTDVPYERYYPGKIRPFTTATALSAGWVREIPLQDRRSLTYVYSSRYIDEPDADRELRANEGQHAAGLDVHLASFSTGHRANAWIGNCVALGASGASIDPLESGGLYLADLGTMALAEHFPFDGDFAPFAFRYNRIMANRFYEILDFVNMQYCLTRRTDTEFWRDVARPDHIYDRLKAKLEFWKLKAPSASDFVDQRFPGQEQMPLASGGAPGDRRSPVDTAAVFSLQSHEAMLYGMQFLADECNDWFGTSRPPTQVPQYIMRDLQRAPATLPPHDIFLQRVAGMPAYAGSAGARR